MASTFLKNALAQESRAYGFTIAFWGSGMVLVNSYGVPGIQNILMYGGGAVLGFAALTVYAYKDALSTVETEENQVVGLGMVHYLASLVPILIASYISNFGAEIAFGVTGFTVSTVYNLGMIVEEKIGEELGVIQNRII